MNDFVRYALSFVAGLALGTMTVLFAWSVTDATYDPYYGYEHK